MRPALIVACLGCAACQEQNLVLSPTVEVPPVTSNAYPYADLDRMELFVQREDENVPIVSGIFERGQTLSLSNVPFELDDDLGVHMRGRVAGFEVAYGRTCPFRVQPSLPPPDLLLYFSRTLKWAPGPPPTVPDRTGSLAYTARDGSAVFVGCDSGCEAVDTVDRFDPHTGSFMPLDSHTPSRPGAAMAAFGDGRALVVGGLDGSGDAVGAVDLLNPLAPTGRQLEAVVAPRFRLVRHAAASLVDGSIFIVGGMSQPADGMPFAASADAYLFSIAADGSLALPAGPVARLATARSGHTATRLGDQVGAPVLVVGGQDSTGAPVASAELYEPLRGQFSPPATFHPALSFPRYGHAAGLLPDGSVLVVGGRDANGMPVRELEQYVQGTFQRTGVYLDPVAAGVTDFVLINLPDGNLLLIGGRNAAGQPVDSVYIARLDPVLGVVDLVATDHLSTPRAGHAAALLCDGTIFVIGGAPGSERYDPPSANRRH
jgi:hypothetical protein